MAKKRITKGAKGSKGTKPSTLDPGPSTVQYPWIAEDLRHLAVPIDQLKPLEGNPVEHDDDNVRGVMGQLRAHGQYHPLVANSRNNQVVIGNCRLQAAKRLGWSHIAVLFRDLTDAQARRLAFEDNRSGELSTWDEDTLLALIASVEAEDPDTFDNWINDLLLDDLVWEKPIHPADKPLEETPVPPKLRKMPLPDLLRGMDRRIVMFSGGKDSMATVSWMLDHFKPSEFELLWNKTPLDYPDFEQFVDAFAKKIKVRLHKVVSDYEGPEFLEQIRRNGLPAEMRNWCTGCWKVRPTINWLKSEKLSGSRDAVLVVGWRREEGLRRSEASDRVLSTTHDLIMVRPILDLTTDQVFAEIKRRRWKAHWVYEFNSRLGCLYCHCIGPEEFKGLRQRRPDLWWYCLKLLAVGSRAEKFQPQLGKAIRRLIGEEMEPFPFPLPEGALTDTPFVPPTFDERIGKKRARGASRRAGRGGRRLRRANRRRGSQASRRER